MMMHLLLTRIIFYLGGQGSNGIPESLVRIYNSINKKWEALDETLSTRGDCGCFWYKGAIVRIGGSIGGDCLGYTDIFYPVGYRSLKLNLKRIQKMAVSRRRLGACCVDDVIYAIGGLCDRDHLNTVEAYNIKDRKWQEKTPMQYCRGDVAVVELRGSIMAIGGSAGVRSSIGNCELYDPLNNDWHGIASLNIPRHGAGAVTIDEFVYVFGGFNNDVPLKSVEKYVPESDEWIIISDMKYPRGEVGIATIGRNVHIIGGKDRKRHLGIMEIYNVDDNSWKEGPTLSNCKVGADVVTAFINPEHLEKLQEKILHGVLIEDF